MTSKSLLCLEKVRKGAKRHKKEHVAFSRLSSNWSFSNGMNSEQLAEVGLDVLDDDDDDDDSSNSSSLSAHGSTKRKAGAANSGTRQGPFYAHFGPTPPGSISSCTAPPKNKHHRSEASKKQHSEDQTPFKMRRRTRADSPTGQDAFTRISDEVVLQIFKWLPKTTLINCARTCKRWKLLSYDHSLWARINLGDQTVGSGTLRHVLGRGVVVLRLAKCDIQEPQDISLPSSFPTIGNRRFCKLHHLDLSMAVVSEATLEGILSVCNNLRNLSLELCSLNENICRYVSANQKLEKLNLSMSIGLTETGIESVLSKCDSLLSLNLAWTNLSQAAVDTAIKNMPKKLQQLNLSGCRQTLRDQHLEDLFEICMDLKDLDVSDAVKLTDLAVQNITDLGYDLESIALTRCYGISKESCMCLYVCPYLEHLQIFGLFNSIEISHIQTSLKGVAINKKPFSDIARPTTGISRTSIWGLRVRD